MEKYFFMKPLLELLAQGRFFRKLTATFLRIAAVITPICCLILILVLGKQILDLPTAGKVGGVIFILFYVVAIYMMVHTLLMRAGNVADLGESDFNVVYVAFVLTKLAGELSVIFILLLSVGGGIFVWFGGPDAAYILQGVFRYFPRVSDTLTAGFVVLLGGITLAFGVLVLAYLWAELLLVWVSIAQNTKKVKG